MLCHWLCQCLKHEEGGNSALAEPVAHVLNRVFNNLFAPCHCLFQQPAILAATAKARE